MKISSGSPSSRITPSSRKHTRRQPPARTTSRASRSACHPAFVELADHVRGPRRRARGRARRHLVGSMSSGCMASARTIAIAAAGRRRAGPDTRARGRRARSARGESGRLGLPPRPPSACPARVTLSSTVICGKRLNVLEDDPDPAPDTIDVDGGSVISSPSRTMRPRRSLRGG